MKPKCADGWHWSGRERYCEPCRKRRFKAFMRPRLEQMLIRPHQEKNA